MKKNYVEISEDEKTKLLTLDNQTTIMLNNLGRITYQLDFLKEEKKNLEERIKKNQLDYEKEVQYILQKNKVVGQIKRIDFANNKILLL